MTTSNDPDKFAYYLFLFLIFFGIAGGIFIALGIKALINVIF